MKNFPTIKTFLDKSMIPVGHTMYIYGGGWDDDDFGAGFSARCIGDCKSWRDFFNTQTEEYDYKKFVHCSTFGLDCTGYIGWAVYNLFNIDDGENGYVFESRCIGDKLHSLGLGSVTKAENVSNFRCGDIFYSAVHRHAYIVIGECEDKSLVIVHSSPPGVMVSGTAAPDGKKSYAQEIANKFMRENYPEWCAKFPISDRDSSYLYNYNRFRFYSVVVPDPEGITQYRPEKILNILKLSCG